MYALQPIAEATYRQPEALTLLLQDQIPVIGQPLQDLVLPFLDRVLQTVHLQAAVFTVRPQLEQPTHPVQVLIEEHTVEEEVTAPLHLEAADIPAEIAAEATHPHPAAEAAAAVTQAEEAATRPEEAATRPAEAAHAAAVLLQEDKTKD